MIFGHMVKLYENRISVPESLLQPVGIEQDSVVFGFYYRRNKSFGESYKYLGLEVDLGFSPIAYKVWPSLARIKIFLSHRPGRLEKVADLLSYWDISILTANVIRFGHRYAEWDMMVDLHRYKMSMASDGHALYDEEKDIRLVELKSKIADVERRLKEKDDEGLSDSEIEGNGYGNFLFRDLDWEPPLRATPVYLLFDHYDKCEEAKEHGRTSDQSFSAKCIDGGIEFEPQAWGEIKAESGLAADLRNGGFCHAIASFDSRSLTLRAAIIPESKRDSFRKIRLQYELTVPERRRKQGAPEDTCGLLAAVADILAPANLWVSHNWTIQRTDSSEVGFMEFVAQRIDNSSQGVFDGIRKRLRNWQREPKFKRFLRSEKDLHLSDPIIDRLEAPPSSLD